MVLDPPPPPMIKSQQRTPKPKIARTVPKKFLNNLRALSNKTRVLMQITSESSPESSARSLSHKFFGVPFRRSLIWYAPPPFSRPVIFFRGNGHRPDEFHFLRPPKLVWGGHSMVRFPLQKLDDTFCPPLAISPVIALFIDCLGRGTFCLVFTVGCNVILGQTVFGGISIACVLMVMIYSLGKSSGANFNPAVSVALGFSEEDGMDWGQTQYC